MKQIIPIYLKTSIKAKTIKFKVVTKWITNMASLDPFGILTSYIKWTNARHIRDRAKI